MPISAIAGKRDLMLHYRPVGDCEHSGTYLAHLSTVLGALAALDAYEAPGFYPRLNRLGARLAEGLQAIGDRHGVPLRVQYVGPRFGMYFGVTEPVIHYRQAAQQDREMLYTFIAACIHRGLYVHVSPHHGISSAHTDAEIDQALAIMDEAMAKVRDAHL
jgi:glutamate-1-semialdehyde 2,1-aminomutase